MRYLVGIIVTLMSLSCSERDGGINDSSKRNSNWTWHVDKTGAGSWVPAYGLKMNLPDGLVTTFYDNGQTHSQTKIANNEKIDSTWYFHDSIEGKLIKIHVENESGEDWWYPENGAFKRYYQDGNLYEAGEVVSHRHGQNWVVYHRNGRPAFIDYQETETGVRRYSNYFANGQISDTAETLNGKPHGISKIWDESGTVLEHVEWKNGLESGSAKFYYSNGLLKSEAQFVDGEKHGLTKRYYESGSLMYVSNFEQGRRNGVLKHYFESGNISQDAVFLDGMPIGRYFYESGELFATSERASGEKSLEITYFKKSGVPFYKEFVENDYIQKEDTIGDMDLTPDERIRFENRRNNSNTTS